MATDSKHPETLACNAPLAPAVGLELKALLFPTSLAQALIGTTTTPHRVLVEASAYTWMCIRQLRKAITKDT